MWAYAKVAIRVALPIRRRAAVRNAKGATRQYPATVAEPPVDLLGELAAGVFAVGDLEEHRLDLGAELRTDLLGVDVDPEAVGRPGGQAVAVVPRAVLALRPLGQEPGQADPDGELRLFPGIELPSLGLEAPDDLDLGPRRGPRWSWARSARSARLRE